MKQLFNHFSMLVFAFVLAVSPIQSISASVAKCVTIDSGVHSHMMSADHAEKMGLADSAHAEDCCNQSECNMTHCAGSMATVITSYNINTISHLLSSVHKKPNTLSISFFPSSLYRPPKL